MKMNKTVVVRRDYLHYVKKYNRFEKRHKNMSVHLSPCFRDVNIGDVVTVGECRLGPSQQLTNPAAFLMNIFIADLCPRPSSSTL